jgi:hypothetical protein
MKLQRVLAIVAENSRTIAGLNRLAYRRCHATFIDAPAGRRAVEFNADLGRYDSEGDAFVCEMLNCLLGDLISVKAV